MAEKLWAIKLRRRSVAWLRITLRECASPFISTKALLQFLAFPIALYLAFDAGGLWAMTGEIAGVWKVALPFLYAIPIFIVVMAIRAIFLVKKEEDASGKWFGDSFVYHEPLLVETLRITDADNDRRIPVKLPDAECGGSVQARIEFDGFETQRVKVQLVREKFGGLIAPWEWVTGTPRILAFLPDDKTFYLIPKCETSNHTIVRVFLISWCIR